MGEHAVVDRALRGPGHGQQLPGQVGYTEVADLARELLAVPGATERTVHDRMLAHGSPPVRLLRTVV